MDIRKQRLFILHFSMLMVAGFVLTAVAACGPSYEDTKRQDAARRKQLWREDSAALKVAVLPTLDCLPLYVAKERGMFGQDSIRLKLFTAQMDCDTAVIGGSAEGVVTDLVRAERMKAQGTPLRYVAATNAYWLLVTSRNARIHELKQLDDKMVAMTRYSATDMLSDMAVDSAKLKSERVFRIQVNDVWVRLQMLQVGVMDAMLLTEPQATLAKLQKGRVLMDTRQMDLQLGVMAFREKTMQDKQRQQQVNALLKGYNEACDSLNAKGLEPYRDVLEKYYKGLKPAMVDSLPKNLKFPKAAEPRQKDVEQAEKWNKELENREAKYRK